MAYCCLFFLKLVTFSFYLPSSTAQLNSTVVLLPGVSSNWTNNDISLPTTIRFTDGSVARFILLCQGDFNTTITATSSSSSQAGFGFGFGFCFYCPYSTDEALCYLAVVFVEMGNGMILTRPPKVVWSANRDNPVSEDATLSFSASQSLVLCDTDSSAASPVWSAKTTSVLVSSLSTTKKGNLVIFNRNGGVAWQSFDHLTDTLLDVQSLAKFQCLNSSVSIQNMSSGLFYVYINLTWLSAYSKADYLSTPTRYLNLNLLSDHARLPLNNPEFSNGSVTYYSVIMLYFSNIRSKFTTNSTSVHILKLDSDGGLRIYGWEPGKEWKEVYVFTKESNECQFPLKCGRYGVCDEEENCSCPTALDGVPYFISNGSFGCSQVHFQGTSDHYRLVKFANLSYYIYYDMNQAIPGLENEASCVEACERNKSCQAAFFKFDKYFLQGYCFLVTSVLSLMTTSESSAYRSSSYIKIRIYSHNNSKTTSAHSDTLVLALLASFAFLLAVLTVTIVVMLVLKKRKVEKWNDQAFLKQVSSEIAIKSFSYRELYVATAKFSKKLGRGGFGTVFKGVLEDGTVVAVKRLETMRGTKEFLAEVESIGNIHHINLVRLMGFCASRKHRMLVYEYMSKGSLDKWIFCKNPDAAFDWNTRKKVVIDIAKGLTYLHEECRHKIAHLDVKPHNILLDDNFNAKLSDFGMSKLISRDESQVVTEVRGTLGYLAPEWEDSRITVKADVYSFGILLLEIITGRKILDYSQPHSDVHLLSLLGKKASENRLKDMIECQSEDIQNHVEEAIDMMKLGMWCSDGDYNRRPSMSMVLKILDSGLNAA